MTLLLVNCIIRSIDWKTVLLLFPDKLLTALTLYIVELGPLFLRRPWTLLVGYWEEVYCGRLLHLLVGKYSGDHTAILPLGIGELFPVLYLHDMQWRCGWHYYSVTLPVTMTDCSIVCVEYYDQLPRHDWTGVNIYYHYLVYNGPTHVTVLLWPSLIRWRSLSITQIITPCGVCVSLSLSLYISQLHLSLLLIYLSIYKYINNIILLYYIPSLSPKHFPFTLGKEGETFACCPFWEEKRLCPHHPLSTWHFVSFPKERHALPLPSFTFSLPHHLSLQGEEEWQWQSTAWHEKATLPNLKLISFSSSHHI